MKFSVVISVLFASIAIASSSGPAAEGKEARGVNDVFEANEARACKLRDAHCSKASETNLSSDTQCPQGALHLSCLINYTVPDLSLKNWLRKVK
ncbi:uncharacterized protein FTOL_07769 [Fusarium torulosum]|uniref:Uncharacterized protein n=1 Tax=Fusarium torulosum TaxID=33205 RepID=A0AAE8MCK0_9HYPO|nr:uncharacterized protein FTOL_07769 [Fusarium torulosum]